MKKLTIKDIAKLAGVHMSTVSKAINNYADIPDETRNKILKTIKENNYYPLESARLLGKRKTDDIVFLSTRTTAYFNAAVLRAIEDRAGILDKYVHRIIPYSSYYNKEIAEDLFKKLLYGRKASALIALAMNPSSGPVLKYKNAGIPLILIENRMKNSHSVNIDNRQGGYLAAEYLIKSGRKKIGLICGGLDIKSKYGYSYAAEQRKAGFDDALKKYGIKQGPEYIEQAFNYTVREGVALFNKFLHKGVNFEAVFCSSGDMTAMGVMESAMKYGMKIPQDLAVIGYDDNYYSAYLNPPLTTIRQPIDRLGAEAFNLAMGAIEGKKDSFKHIEIEPEFVKRQSA